MKLMIVLVLFFVLLASAAALMIQKQKFPPILADIVMEKSNKVTFTHPVFGDRKVHIETDQESYRCLQKCTIIVSFNNSWFEGQGNVTLNASLESKPYLRQEKVKGFHSVPLQKTTYFYEFEVDVPQGMKETKMNISVDFNGFNFVLDPPISSGCEQRDSNLFVCNGTLTGNSIDSSNSSIWIYNATIDATGSLGILTINTSFGYINLTNTTINSSGFAGAGGSACSPGSGCCTPGNGEGGGNAIVVLSAANGTVYFSNSTIHNNAGGGGNGGTGTCNADCGACTQSGGSAGAGGMAFINITSSNTTMYQSKVNNIPGRGGNGGSANSAGGCATAQAGGTGGKANMTFVNGSMLLVNTPFFSPGGTGGSGGSATGNGACLSQGATTPDSASYFKGYSSRVFFFNITWNLSWGSGSNGNMKHSNSTWIITDTFEVSNNSHWYVNASGVPNGVNVINFTGSTRRMGIFNDTFFQDNVTIDCSGGLTLGNSSFLSNVSFYPNCDPLSYQDFPTFESEISAVTSPLVVIVTPSNYSNFSTGTQDFNVTIQETDIDVVRFVFDNSTGNDFNVSPSNISGNWNTNINLLLFTEGLHQFTVYANDTFKNVNYSELVQFKVDRTAPLINTFVMNYTNASNFTRGVIQINSTINDTFTYVQAVRYGVQNNRNNSEFNLTPLLTNSFWTLDLNLDRLMDGLYTIRIYTNDTLDNLNNSVSNVSFTIDNNPPNVTLFLMNRTNNSAISKGVIQFNATVNDTTTTVQNVLFGFRNDKNQSSFNVSSSLTSGIWQFNLPIFSLLDGNYSLSIFANDSVGNINTSSLNVSFMVDSTPPNVTSLVMNATNNSNFSRGRIQINVTVNDTMVRTDFVLLNLFNSRNGTAFNISASLDNFRWVTTLIPENLLDGSYNVQVYANDSLGNMNNSVSTLTLFIDNNAPNVTAFLINSTNATNFTRGVIQINTSLNDTVSTVQEVLFGLTNDKNNSEFNVTTSRSSWFWTSSVQMDRLLDGLYSIRVYGNDSLGNMNNSQSGLAFRIDTNAPNITAFLFNYSNSSNFTNGMIQINATLNDSTTTVQEVLFGIESISNNSQFNISPVRVGSFWTANLSVSSVLIDSIYTIHLYGNDSVGNLNNSNSNLSFLVDNHAPNVTTAGMNITSGSTVIGGTVQINATLNDTMTTVQEVLFGISNTANNSQFNVTTTKSGPYWTADIPASALIVGTYTIRVYGNDSLGNMNSSVANMTFIVSTAEEDGTGGRPGPGVEPPGEEPENPQEPIPDTEMQQIISGGSSGSYQGTNITIIKRLGTLSINPFAIDIPVIQLPHLEREEAVIDIETTLTPTACGFKDQHPEIRCVIEDTGLITIRYKPSQNIFSDFISTKLIVKSGDNQGFVPITFRLFNLAWYQPLDHPKIIPFITKENKMGTAVGYYYLMLLLTIVIFIYFVGLIKGKGR